MRVKTHPDQVKREKPYLTAEDMVRVTAVAAQVGEAADVLGDSSQVRGAVCCPPFLFLTVDWPLFCVSLGGCTLYIDVREGRNEHTMI